MPDPYLPDRFGDAVKATFTALDAVKVAFRDLRGDEKCDRSDTTCRYIAGQRLDRETYTGRVRSAELVLQVRQAQGCHGTDAWIGDQGASPGSPSGSGVRRWARVRAPARRG